MVCHLQGKATTDSPWKILWQHYPLQLVHIDYLCLELGKVKEENVLVVTDHFTCYAQAYVTSIPDGPRQWPRPSEYNFIVYYGLLEKILSRPGEKF